IPVTSLIGREQELGEVVRRLIGARLLTLTGIGGWGQTRHPPGEARGVVARHSDGGWVVGVGPPPRPPPLPPPVCPPPRGREAAGQTITSTLTTALRNRHLLLVLDNCEHLLDACARLVDDLVHSCADVQVLATSREALGLTGEVAWRVPSLSVPAANQQYTLA